MTPNQITLARVAAAFTAVALYTCFNRSVVSDLAAITLTITAMALDGADGYIARKRGLATPLGAQLDILGDRVIENLFFTFFAAAGLISLWVPIVFFVRGALTDFLRGLAARAGRGGFGPHGMLETNWGRALVSSRASRAAYATLKCLCFCYLGMLPLATRLSVHWLSPANRLLISWVAHGLVAATLFTCVLRAVPVFWHGRRYFAAMENRKTLPAGATR